MIKLLLINPSVMSCNCNYNYLMPIVFSFRVRMSVNIGDNRELFLNLEIKFGLCFVVLTKPRNSPERITSTLLEMQQLSDIEETDSEEEFSCQRWTIYNGRRNQTHTDRLNIVDRYRSNISKRFGNGTENNNMRSFFLNESIS